MLSYKESSLQNITFDNMCDANTTEEKNTQQAEQMTMYWRFLIQLLDESDIGQWQISVVNLAVVFCSLSICYFI